MFSFLAELFGKSRDVRELERQLRQLGVNPYAVNDATKFTVCKWVREALLHDGTTPEEKLRLQSRLRGSAAELLAFCALGREDFEKANSTALAEAQEERLEAAAEGGQAMDAEIIMLTLHAGVAHPEIAEAFEIETAD